VEPAHSKGSLAGLISTDDYPSDALRNQQTGTVRVRLDVSSGGRVTGCSVVSSSGVPSLDSATCRLLTSRARFTPARDSNGNPTSDTVTSPAIVWRIQEQ
jgi:protein TonB